MIEFTSDTLSAQIEVHPATVMDILEKDAILGKIDYDNIPEKERTLTIVHYPNMIVCSEGFITFGDKNVDVKELTLEQMKQTGILFSVWRDKVMELNPELFGITRAVPDTKKKK